MLQKVPTQSPMVCSLSQTSILFLMADILPSTMITGFDVSRRLHEDYGNGKDYYKYHGQKLLILPEKKIELPSKEFLRWHNENEFLT